MACADHTVPTVCVKPVSCNVAAFAGLLQFKVKLTPSHPSGWPDQACIERLRIDQVDCHIGLGYTRVLGHQYLYIRVFIRIRVYMD